MHPSAKENGKRFFDTYVASLPRTVQVIDIGSQDVNGTLRDVCPQNCNYTGLDFQEAKGVDIVLDDPYELPLDSSSIDIAVSSSCYEHSEFFWLSFLEVMRVLKDDGLFYLNVPSDGAFHRYPVDCWRFYPDSGPALANWAKRNGLNTAVLECYTTNSSHFNDYVSVFIKNADFQNMYPDRIVNTFKNCTNVQVIGKDGLLNHSQLTERDRKLATIQKIISNEIDV